MSLLFSSPPNTKMHPPNRFPSPRPHARLVIALWCVLPVAVRALTSSKDSSVEGDDVSALRGRLSFLSVSSVGPTFSWLPPPAVGRDLFGVSEEIAHHREIPSLNEELLDPLAYYLPLGRGWAVFRGGPAVMGSWRCAAKALWKLPVVCDHSETEEEPSFLGGLETIQGQIQDTISDCIRKVSYETILKTGYTSWFPTPPPYDAVPPEVPRSPAQVQTDLTAWWGGEGLALLRQQTEDLCLQRIRKKTELRRLIQGVMGASGGSPPGSLVEERTLIEAKIQNIFNALRTADEQLRRPVSGMGETVQESVFSVSAKLAELFPALGLSVRSVATGKTFPNVVITKTL